MFEKNRNVVRIPVSYSYNWVRDKTFLFLLFCSFGEIMPANQK